MTTLANFPMKDQRTEKTSDARPPENAPYDCVATSFAAGIQYYDGGYVNGDELKDAEYGETYANAGTALWRYVDNATDRARAIYHVTAEAYNDTNTQGLIDHIRGCIQAGAPVIATIPSSWDTAHTQAALANPGFSTHAIIFYIADNGYLGAMNPWNGFKQYMADSWWHDRLCYGQVWKIVREAGAVPAPTPQETLVTITAAQTNGYYTAQADGSWKCSNGHKVMGGILDFYTKVGNGGPGTLLNGLSILGLALTDELAPDPSYQGRIQVYERGVVAYDPSHKWDDPSGSDPSPVYFAKVNRPEALAVFAAAVLAERDALKGQVASVNDQLASANTALAAARASLDAAQADGQTAKDALAQAQLDVAALRAQAQGTTQALSALQAFAAALDMAKGTPRV